MNTKTSNRRSRGNSSERRRRPSRNTSSRKRSGGDRNRDRNNRSRFRRGGGGNKRGGRKQPSFDPSRFINTNPVEMVEEVYVPKHTFDSFGLEKGLAGNIKKMGITSPSPIQDKVIPIILEGKDVIGLAETGTGKTAAFLVPLINMTQMEKGRSTLILTPTRELAIQIEQELHKLSKGMRMFSVTCVGGVNIAPQIRALRKPNQFIIGTPGRVLDLMKRGRIIPETITSVVLDEADRMLDMGFINDMRAILEPISPDRETLFFSATMTKEAENLVGDFLRDPVEVSVKKKDVTDSIAQDIVPHGHHDKYETLLSLLNQPDMTRVLIFGSMKHSVQKLAKSLAGDGIKADAIHGNKTHGQRQKALTRFKKGEATVLVATDVAARGIHVDNVSHVINYDLPQTFEDYVHRIGRTGRGTKKGQALTFVQGSR